MNIFPHPAGHGTSLVGAPFGQDPQDQVLAGLIEQGHGREACAAYLGIADDELMDRVVRLDLPTPTDKPMRVSHAANAWGVDSIRRLIDLWVRKLTTGHIGSALGRSPGSIRAKAKWLGLYRRDRKSLLDILPLFPDFDSEGTKPKRREIVWNEGLEKWLAERWLAFEHPAAIARDLTEMLGVEIKSGAISMKAHRLELPRRDPYFLLHCYAPGNREKHAHLLPKVTPRYCKIRKKLFWSAGNLTSAEAKRQSNYRSLTSGLEDCSVAAH